MVRKSFKTTLALLSLLLFFGAVSPFIDYSQWDIAPYCDDIFAEN